MSASFADLGVPAPVVSALRSLGVTEPFPIQSATLPDALAGRDVLGRGRTGSGKTIAFAVPTVAALAGGRRTPGRPRALVLVPTRELAAQVDATLSPLARSLGVRTTTVFGGVSQRPQVAALSRGVDVVVATPGRLEDLIAQGHLRLDAVEVTVLDEADHMADLGFLPAVRRLLDATPRGGQRLLFSATLDRAVDQLVRRYLRDPVTHSVDSAASPVPAMTHHLFQVTHDGKAALVRALVSGEGRTVAFTRTKHGAKRLARDLTREGIPAVDLHGNLSQAARQRNLDAFGSGRTRVLVATDVAARGIHVDDVALVLHVDPPNESKAFLHRSGRTARAGAEGIVVTVSTPEQRRDVRTLMKQAGVTPVTTDVRDLADAMPAVEGITGPAVPRVAPVVAAAPRPATTAPARPRRRPGPRDGEARRPRRPQGGPRSDGPTGPTRSGSPRGRRGGNRQGAAPRGSTGGAAAFSAGQRRGR